MNGNARVAADNRRFRTNIPAIIAAMLLFGSVQTIVMAFQEPLQAIVVWLINLSIDRGHFVFNRIAHHGPLWGVAVANFVYGCLGLALGYLVAHWSYNRRRTS